MNATSNSNFTVFRAATFLRQPSTVLGLSALIGTLTALLTAQISWQAAIPAIAGALTAIVLPDNAGAQAAIEDVASAAVQAEQAISAPGVITGATQAMAQASLCQRAQVTCVQGHSLGCSRATSDPATLSDH